MPRVKVEGLWVDDEQLDSSRDGAHFRMASGREYVLASSLLAGSPEIAREARLAFTRYIDEHPEQNPVIFATHNAPSILARPAIPFSARAKLLATEITRRIGHRPASLRIGLTPDDPEFLRFARASYVETPGELHALMKYWSEQGVLDFQQTLDGQMTVSVPVRGLIALEEESGAAESDTAFVAMWFADEMVAAFDDGIAPAIEQLGYRAVRIDRREHNNKIDDEIIAEIRRARFLIADFSCGEDGARGGVYFEAGFAAGLGKPVIYTARAADFPRVHFDTRQFNHIVWNSHEELRERLVQRIGATIGDKGATV